MPAQSRMGVKGFGLCKPQSSMHPTLKGPHCMQRYFPEWKPGCRFPDGVVVRLVACHGTLKETGIHVLRIKMLIMSTTQTRMMKITMQRATGKHHGETETDHDNNELWWRIGRWARIVMRRNARTQVISGLLALLSHDVYAQQHC